MAHRPDNRPYVGPSPKKDNRQYSRKQDNGYEHVGFNNVLSPDVRAFCEAVTQPFGSFAVGAVLPDRYQEVVIPAMDIQNIDLGLDSFNYNGDWTKSGSAKSGVRYRLLGCLIWLQPRCIAAGVLETQDLQINTDDKPEPPVVKYPSVCRPAVSDSNCSAHSDDIDCLTELYTLCYTGSWSVETYVDGHTVGVTRSVGLFSAAPSSSKSDCLFPGFRVLPFPRIGNIATNCSRARILGMGMKIWSEETSIDIGGFSTAGWLSLNDVLKAACDTSGRAINDIGAQSKGSVRRHGKGGVAARYSPLQDSRQLVHQPCFVDKKLYYPNIVEGFECFSFGGPAMATNGPSRRSGWDREYAVAGVKSITDLARFDVVGPNSLVPVCSWHFNNSSRMSVDGSNITDGVHGLRVRCIVHVEAQPSGDCPFLGGPVDKFSGINLVNEWIEDWHYFPPATNGHNLSFTSFMKRSRKIKIKVQRGLGHLNKLMALLDYMTTKVNPRSMKSAY